MFWKLEFLLNEKPVFYSRPGIYQYNEDAFLNQFCNFYQTVLNIETKRICQFTAFLCLLVMGNFDRNLCDKVN